MGTLTLHRHANEHAWTQHQLFTILQAPVHHTLFGYCTTTHNEHFLQVFARSPPSIACERTTTPCTCIIVACIRQCLLLGTGATLGLGEEVLQVLLGIGLAGFLIILLLGRLRVMSQHATSARAAGVMTAPWLWTGERAKLACGRSDSRQHGGDTVALRSLVRRSHEDVRDSDTPLHQCETGTRCTVAQPRPQISRILIPMPVH